MIKRLFKVGLLTAIVVAAWQSQALADWWQLRNYEPPASIAAIAERTGFTDGGERLFYVAKAELNDKNSFNINCPTADRANVLGCYTPTGIFNSGRIYLLQVDREELDGVEEVTAAHELLHAAYQRLSSSEREDINRLLEADFKKFAEAGLKDKINLYEDDAALRLNEIHSFLGTEVETLSPELEEYYRRYFEDRGQVVSLFKEYEQIFEQIEARTARLQAELTQLKAELDTLEGQIVSKRAELEETRSRMDSLLASEQTEAYNELVPQHNRLLAEHNGLVGQYNSQVTTHNSKAQELNRLSLRQNDLAQSLNSRQPQ